MGSGVVLTLRRLKQSGLHVCTPECRSRAANDWRGGGSRSPFSNGLIAAASGRNMRATRVLLHPQHSGAFWEQLAADAAARVQYHGRWLAEQRRRLQAAERAAERWRLWCAACGAAGGGGGAASDRVREEQQQEEGQHGQQQQQQHERLSPEGVGVAAATAAGAAAAGAIRAPRAAAISDRAEKSPQVARPKGFAGRSIEALCRWQVPRAARVAEGARAAAAATEGVVEHWEGVRRRAQGMVSARPEGAAARAVGVGLRSPRRCLLLAIA